MKRMAMRSIVLTMAGVFAAAAIQASSRPSKGAEPGQQQPTGKSAVTVVQMSYYARPGKEDEVRFRCV